MEARPPRAGYVLRKFIARYRLAATAAAGMTAMLLAAGALILRQSRIAAHRFEERSARRAEARN